MVLLLYSTVGSCKRKEVIMQRGHHFTKQWHQYYFFFESRWSYSIGSLATKSKYPRGLFKALFCPPKSNSIFLFTAIYIFTSSVLFYCMRNNYNYCIVLRGWHEISHHEILRPKPKWRLQKRPQTRAKNDLLHTQYYEYVANNYFLWSGW